MGGWKNVINGWVRHIGGVDLKLGEGSGNRFQTNFGATKDT